MPQKPFNLTDWDKKHFARTDEFTRQIESIYLTAIKEATRLATGLKVNPEKIFSFSDYPATNKRIKAIMEKMASQVQATIRAGQKAEWLLSNAKNDALVSYVLGTTDLPRAAVKRYMNHNLEALASFQARKQAGLGLSDRVWNYTHQFRAEIELGLDFGLGEGKSADQLSLDLRGYLKEPDRLFRRVRSKRGNLVLSKAAKAYNPGRGVYRSSYKNAQRLGRTEINMAYREADHDRWGQLDFVVGIEVRRSNNPFQCDICEPLKGRYPKTFKFVGWHPNCRCHAISILATPEELRKLNQMLLNEEDTSGFKSVNEVTEVPKGFTNWISDNQKRLVTAKNLPYFVRDNLKGLKLDLNALPKPKPAPVPDPPPIRFIPDGLEKYKTETGITVDNRIFSLLRKETPLRDEGSGAFYQPGGNYVNLPASARLKRSKWRAESVVYHEYGHAIDWQNDLRFSPEVRDVMQKYRLTYAQNKGELYKSIDKTLGSRMYAAQTGKEFENVEKTLAVQDALMSLNRRYGQGHSEAYFKISGMSEAEFVAHSFENYFSGNDVFKEVMPDLYEEMRSLIEGFLKKLTN